MPPWAEVLAWAIALLCLLAGLLVLILALLHVRYTAAWNGTWGGLALSPHSGFARLEVGFPGFMLPVWEWPPPKTAGVTDAVHGADTQNTQHPDASGTETSTSESATESAHTGPDREKAHKGTRPFKIKPRARRALFGFVTDGKVWKYGGRYVFRAMRRGAHLLHPHLEMAAGHPDPVFLGRMASYWYAVSPLLPLRNATLGFRFQDRQPSFRIRVAGAFSLLSLFWFGILLLITFPFFGLSLRAWHSWRHHNLTGWREWVYRRLQA